MSYGTQFIDIPIKPGRVGRAKNMPKTSPTNEASKPAKRYQKTRGEHYKDIVIAMLVTAVIGFIVGMHFSNSQHDQTAQAVKAATASAGEVKK